MEKSYRSNLNNGPTKWSKNSESPHLLIKETVGARKKLGDTRTLSLMEHSSMRAFIDEKKWIKDNYPKIKEQIIRFLDTYDVDISKIKWIDEYNIVPRVSEDKNNTLGLWNTATEIIELYITKQSQHSTEINFHIFRHEILHSISRNTAHVSNRNQDIKNDIVASKTGIETLNRAGRHFQAMNEGLTELLNVLIGSKSTQSNLSFYEPEVNLVTTIIGSITNGSIPKEGADYKTRENKSEEIFKLFIDAYLNNFSRELKKEIRENFGHKALHLLSSLKAGDLEDKDVNKDIIKFFSVTRHNLKEEDQEWLYQIIIPKIIN